MAVSLHPVTNLVSLLDLEMVKPDAYLGVSPRLGWDRIYGGQVVAQAQAAEAAGYDRVMVRDHFYQLPGIGRPDEPMFETVRTPPSRLS